MPLMVIVQVMLQWCTEFTMHLHVLLRSSLCCIRLLPVLDISSETMVINTCYYLHPLELYLLWPLMSGNELMRVVLNFGTYSPNDYMAS